MRWSVNNYFNSIVEELTIPIYQILLNDASLFDDPITTAVHKYESMKDIQVSLKSRKKSKNMTFFFIMLTPIKCKKLSKILTLKTLLSKVISQSESSKKTNSLFQKFYQKCLTFTLTITLSLMDLTILRGKNCVLLSSVK